MTDRDLSLQYNMKNILKNIAIAFLRYQSKLILRRYKPKIVGITGSVGKTSTKEAIFSVLSKKYQVRQNIKNYNNEIGVPLTIIGADSPGKNIFGWLSLLFQCFFLVTKRSKSYPEILVLEMGADHPGDIDYLTSFVPLYVGVLTAIAPVHLEYFKKVENIVREKQIIIEKLPIDGFAVINGDDLLLQQTFTKTKAKLISVGLNDTNTIKATELKMSTGKEGEEDILKGLSFKLLYAGHIVPVFLPGVLGRHQVYAALAATAVGIAFDMNLVEIVDGLQTFNPPKGRMNLVHGIKKTLIIDDTYNSSPAAARAALEVLKEIFIESGHRRIAIFGDMLELGNYTEQGHREVGHRAVELGIDYLVCVGEKSRDIGRGAKEAGMGEERIYYFENNSGAGSFLKQMLKEGDLILVKGSQSARMEKVVKSLMSNPRAAKHLLARQDSPWVG